MSNVKFAIPQWALDTAIEGLRELALRLEIEAASLSQVNSRDAILMADERLEQAVEVYRASELLANL